MANDNHLKRIAVVGASGTIGSQILTHLLESNNFHVTAITRSDSTATFPQHSSLEVKKGSYSDASFLRTAFQNQDAAVFALNFRAMGEQATLIEAAARAGVKWILPTEYASDGMNAAMSEGIPMLQPKALARKQIEDLAETYPGLSWIGVATNPWTEFSLQQGPFGFSIPTRKATLYAGAGAFNSTTVSQAGLGITRLLSLPLTNPSNPRASLAHYANNFAYLSSFLISQDALFAALQRQTGTAEADWEVERSSIGDWKAACVEGMKKGDMKAGAGLIYVAYMGEGNGGNYEAKAREDREVLGLKEEDLDAVVRRAVEAGEVAKVF